MTSFALITVLCGMAGAPADIPSVREVVTLQDYAPCGVVSLYLVTQMRDVPVDWERVVELVGPLKADRTHSFEDLSRAAKELGMHPVGLRARRENLKDLPMPAIIQVHDPKKPEEPAHLLVLIKAEADGVWLIDAPFPAHFLPDAHLEKTWTGNTLVFARDAAEAQALASPSLSRRTWSLVLWSLVGAGTVLFTLIAGGRWIRAKRHASQPVVPGWDYAIRHRRRLALATVVATSLIVSFAVIAGSGRLSARADRPPRCVFEQPVMDLGQLPPGEKTIPVTIINDGDSPLHITSVTSTCSCAVVKAPEVIEPQQSVVMDVVLTVTPGPRGARITVVSNDPDGDKHVSLGWQGAADPRLVPGGISESSAPVGKRYERTLRLVYPSGKGAIQPRLERFECPSPLVHVTEGKNDPLASRFANSGILVNILGELEINIAIDSPSAPEMLNTIGTFVIKYGESTITVKAPIDVRFTGTSLKPDVDVVTFTAANLAQLKGQERLIRVASNHAASEIEVKNVPNWLRWDIVETSDAGFVLRLSIADEPKDRTSDAAVAIGIKDGSNDDVPVRINLFALGN